MQTWISQFMTEIKKDLPTSKTPIVYTTADWWNACTGNDTAFSAYPLWLASYGVTNPALPAGWNNYTIWQYGQGTVDGISGIDQDELGPVLQVAQAGKAIGAVRLRTLNSLAGQAVTYSATGLPPGLTLNSASGQITGTPAAGDIGHQYTVTVTPSAGAVPSSMSFTWMIHGALTVTSPGNRTTTAGTPVALRVAVSDQDGGSYPPHISVSGLPPGLAMDSTGRDHRLADQAGHLHGARLRVRRAVRVRLDDVHLDDRRGWQYRVHRAGQAGGRHRQVPERPGGEHGERHAAEPVRPVPARSSRRGPRSRTGRSGRWASA